MEGKKFSFEKEKVIDTEAVEKSSDNVKKFGSNNSSWKDKFAKFGDKVGTMQKNYSEFQKKQNALKIEKLKTDVKRTKLEAQLAKNKSQIEKYTKGGKKKKGDPFDLGLGGGGLF